MALAHTRGGLNGVTFKDDVIADLPTFLNVDEFGDTIEIDGVSIAAVLISDEAPGPAGAEGVSLLEQTMYARADDFEYLPVVRQEMSIDGRSAVVLRVDQEQEMLVIRLQWFDS